MWVRLRQTLTLSFMVMLLSFFILMPAALQAQDDTVSSTIQFNGHRFNLPGDLANGFSAFLVAEPTASVISDDEFQPPRTEFRLEIYTDDVGAPPPVGWVNVYDASDLEGYAAHEQYERLRSLLSERPDLSAEQTLPTLYPYQRSALPPDRYSEFFANASYLEAEGYQGITFIYARVVRVGDDRTPVTFYRFYFEGISPDGQRYLSAQVEGLQDLLTPLEGVTNYDDYSAQVQALFHESTDEAVIAWLDQANVMFTSFDYIPQS